MANLQVEALMFKFAKYTSFFILGFSLIFSNLVVAQQEIKWFVQEWKPFNFTRGIDKRTGSNDELIKYLHQYMPQYKIKWVNMDLNHFVKSMKNKQDICKVDLFKTEEREKYALFSAVPSVIDLNLRVFLYEKKAKQFKLKSPVSLEELLSNRKLKTYFPLARKYGKNLDPIITQAEQLNKKLRKDIAAKKLIKNFYKRRIDYLVEYSPVVTYYADYAKLGESLVSYAIKETRPYITSYVACSNTEYGRQVMKDINKVLAEHRHSAEYLSIFEKWHSKKDQKTLRKYYKDFK